MNKSISRLIASMDILQQYPWPREDNDQELIEELEKRGYIVIPAEELLKGNVELLKKIFP
jgi:predicted glycosyltransferase